MGLQWHCQRQCNHRVDNENCRAVWSVLEKNTEANLKVDEGAAEQHRPASQKLECLQGTLQFSDH